MEELIAVNGAEIQVQKQVTGDMFGRWTEFLDASPKTVETYTKSIKQFLLYIQDNQITRPQREDILTYREYLKQRYKPTTVQSYMAAVKLFFQWTESEGLYPDVAKHIKGAKLDKGHKKDYLTSKQVGRILAAVDRDSLTGKRDYAMIALMVTTGLREISVVRADVGDIRTVGDETVLYYQGKGHEEKADYVKLAEPVEEAIREYLKSRSSMDLKAPLFASVANRNSGGRMTTRSVSRIAKQYMVEVGLKSERLTGHSLRHTAATLNLLNGATLEETKQLLGHSNINTTMIYAHALERSKNNSEKRIAKAIFG